MKYILTFLLLSSVCYAQQEFKNYTKVTVCRLVNYDEIGPCSIEYYAKKLKRTGHYIQAMESFNDTLAYNLLKLKTEAVTWNKEALLCGEDSVGKALVTNMFIVDINTHRDTIFITPENKAVFSPKEQLQYFDPDNRITSVFPKEVTEFFKRDFATEINLWKMDSIPAKSLTLNRKSFYGLTRKEFEKEISYFSFTRTDSTYLPGGKFFRETRSYYIGDTKFGFDGVGGMISEILIEKYAANPAFSQTVYLDGVKLGDPEEVLCSKYDNTTLLKNWDAPLSAINNYYTYEVYLDNLEGLVRYTVRNKIIYSIHVEFRYPNGPKKKKPLKGAVTTKKT